MTPTELKAVIDAKAQAEPEFAALRDVGDCTGMAAALSVGRTKVVSHMITERGVMAALGVVAGEAFIEGLEAFAAATLPGGHPLEAAHPGIKRMIGWLKTDAGLDIGSTQAHALLDGLAAAGVLVSGDVATIKALSVQADVIGWYEVAEAMKVA